MRYDDTVGAKLKGKKKRYFFYYYCKGNNLLYPPYPVEPLDLRVC